MPQVSVIVPNYNHAPYLRQRLDSIFNQTFQDFEVIILDDCSTDNSKEIIEEYRNRPQVSHIVYNKVNSGSPFKQWAKGFELVHGEYIWIAESDDWAELNFLEELIPILEKDYTKSLVFSNSIWFSEKGIERYSNVYTHSTSIKGIEFFNKKMISHNSICNASCVLFKKALLKDIPLNYQTFKGCGDWIFWIEFCWRGDIYYYSKPLNHFRQHSQSVTKKNNSSINVIKEYVEIFRYLKKKHMISFFKRQCMAVFFLTYHQKEKDIAKNFPTIYKDLYQEWRKEIWSPTLSRIFVDIMFIFWNIKKFIFSIFKKEVDDFF